MQAKHAEKIMSQLNCGYCDDSHIYSIDHNERAGSIVIIIYLIIYLLHTSKGPYQKSTKKCTRNAKKKNYPACTLLLKITNQKNLQFFGRSFPRLPRVMFALAQPSA